MVPQSLFELVDHLLKLLQLRLASFGYDTLLNTKGKKAKTASTTERAKGADRLRDIHHVNQQHASYTGIVGSARALMHLVLNLPYCVRLGVVRNRMLALLTCELAAPSRPIPCR